MSKNIHPDTNVFRVAGVQFCGRIGLWQDNLRRMRRWAAKAAKARCDLVLFPETSLTGYLTGTENIAPTAQPIPGPGTDGLLKIASQLNIAISAGISEQTPEGFYLSQATALPDGRLHVYRKRFGGEAGYLHGTSATPFDYRGIRIGIAICMDARIFELYREYAYQGVNLILKPNGAWAGPWKEDGDPDFPRKARAHQLTMRADWEKDSHFAACNGMAMLAANAVGDTGWSFVPGGCWFCDGTPGAMKSLSLCCEKSRLRERILIGDIHIEQIKQLQASHGVQTDLRIARAYYATP